MAIKGIGNLYGLTTNLYTKISSINITDIVVGGEKKYQVEVIVKTCPILNEPTRQFNNGIRHTFTFDTPEITYSLLYSRLKEINVYPNYIDC